MKLNTAAKLDATYGGLIVALTMQAFGFFRENLSERSPYRKNFRFRRNYDSASVSGVPSFGYSKVPINPETSLDEISPPITRFL